MPNLSKKIGFWTVFSIVTSSQIGSGVFTLPACLAPYGLFGLLGCILSGIGAMALSFVFAALCARLPYTGGPHVYVEYALGKHIAFFTGWTYWVISWVSTAAIVITSVGYLSPFLVKIFVTNTFLIDYYKQICLVLEILLLFLVGLINLKGIKFAGNTELLLTTLKYIALIVLPGIALFYFNKDNFILNQEITKLPVIQISSKAALLVMWGFIGLETATTPASSVLEASKTIPRAIIFGTLSVALLYLLNFSGIMGLIPGAKLMYSSAPYVDAAHIIFGGNWYLLVVAVAVIVLLGALNAWILTSGQISLGLALDGFMPKIFAIKNKKDAPVYGVIISCLGIIPLLLLTSITTENLAKQVTKIIDLSVIAFLFVYLVCIISFFKILVIEKNYSVFYYLAGLVALIFCVWVISTTSLLTLLIASLFTISGIPLYLFWYSKVTNG